jgi:hypothetical protein
MSVQYPGGRAAILGVIHRHRSETSFNFTPVALILQQAKGYL